MGGGIIRSGMEVSLLRTRRVESQSVKLKPSTAYLVPNDDVCIV